MRSTAFFVATAAVLLACSANPGGNGEQPSGIGAAGLGGASVGICSADDGCDSCNGCIDRCVCLTGNYVECPEACGESGGGGQSFGGSPGSGGGGPPPSGGGPGAGGDGGFGGGNNFGGDGFGGSNSGGGGSGAGGGNGGSGGTPPPPSGGGSTGLGGSTGGGGSACIYPAGPYGTSSGKIIDPNLSWEGYREDQDQVSTISIQEYFDCDGTKGINAVLITQGAIWCSACKAEAAEFNGLMANGWAQKGIRILSLIIEDNYQNPATVKHAKQWKDYFKAKGWAVAADPKFTFASSGSNGLPTVLFVDPRTMKIVAKTQGAGSHSKLEQLAATNATK